MQPTHPNNEDDPNQKNEDDFNLNIKMTGP